VLAPVHEATTVPDGGYAGGGGFWWNLSYAATLGHDKKRQGKGNAGIHYASASPPSRTDGESIAVAWAEEQGAQRMHASLNQYNDPGEWDPPKNPFTQFSAACYYYAQSLSDQLAAANANGQPPPIGMIQVGCR
jgi:hypothetical protein